MTITLIAAVARNGVIGADGAMPWHIPGEQKGFKKATMGHPMIMGRKTFEAMGALPGRRSVVLTRDPDWSADGVEVAHSLDEALFLTQDEDVFVVGGGQIYQVFLPVADRLLLSHVPLDAAGDTTFPGWPLNDEAWTVTQRESHPGWEVVIYERSRPRTRIESGERISKGATKKLSATAVVMRDGLLLMTRREDNGLWCLPGGGVDSGETWAEAACREVLEETGLTVTVDGVLGVYTDPDRVAVYPSGDRRQIYGVCFRCQVASGSAGLSDEVTQVAWLSRDETRRLPIIPLHRALVAQAFESRDAPATFV